MTPIMETSNEKLWDSRAIMSVMAIHPGEVLGEELKSRGISQKEFAQSVGMQATHLSALIHGMRNITPALAAKLETGLPGITASFWLGLQAQYNLDVSRKKLNTSSVVTGYGVHSGTNMAPALAEPGAIYGETCQITMSVPQKDMNLLKDLAQKFNWKIVNA